LDRGTTGQVPAEDCSGVGFHDTCNFYEICGYHCEIGDVCPSAGPGAPPSVCVESADDGFSNLCVLPCSVTAECPDGMDCVLHPYGLGRNCMWKAHVSAGGSGAASAGGAQNN